MVKQPVLVILVTFPAPPSVPRRKTNLATWGLPSRQDRNWKSCEKREREARNTNCFTAIRHKHMPYDTVYDVLPTSAGYDNNICTWAVVERGRRVPQVSFFYDCVVKYTAHSCRGSSLRKHATTKVKISEEITRVAEFCFNSASLCIISLRFFWYSLFLLLHR